ncbi:MAG: sulfatase-like hydrolase/transferase [Bacteroidota bacterium]|nr:sulfatase-like hydrolase/transferase [Bacteroidota bacterium]
MKLKKYISFLYLVLIPFLGFGQQKTNKPGHNEKPNIIFILADDLGWGDLSCQGATDLKTPNIDKILNGGIKFNNFYSNSCVCSPSRAALLTGRYPDMVGVPGLVRDIKADNWGYLTPGTQTLPQLLKKANYQTAIIGKWNLGLEHPNLPNDKGFDQFYGFLDDMMDDYYTHLRNGQNFMRINQQVVDPKGHATEIFTNWALDYLQKQLTKKNPFFLYLTYNAPHVPIQPPKEWLDKVKAREPNITEKRAKIVALIEHLDYNIGLIMHQLESTHMLDNTLIIFTSDNGGRLDVGANNGPYRGGKQDMYEGGIREPAGIMWKNKIQPGQVSDNFVMMMDMLPTLCDLTGAKIERPIDGMSILPLLRGEKQVTDNRLVYFVRREGNMRYGGLAYYAARLGPLKILQNTPFEPMQYFDMNNDPYEKHPLKEKGDKDYKQMFMNLTEHIRLAGSVPWEKNEINK